MAELPKTYDPTGVEPKWYKVWKDAGYFHAVADHDRKPYSITIPPPNVTGSLHIGHALCYTIQDVLARWKRMQGYEVLVLPGTDHAGIATQNAVERTLAREGLTRHDLGREKFLERVWQWKEQYGGAILDQFKRMGYSFDWDRTRFTLDDGYYKAVAEHFVRLYEAGHIYRGERVINWCPRCSTAISDIEIEYVEKDAELYHIDYPFEDGSGYVTVATTRPETMLGDTGIAVNPKDPRYKDVIGKRVILPVMNRPIPIVADDYADPSFGTGAVKVTPAHDPNDFEVGRRQNLPSIAVIGTSARMTAAAGKYAGKDRYECRRELLEELKSLGVLRKVEPYNLSVNTCARCHTVVEPLLLEQWFVRMADLAKPAADVVREGKVKFVPERFSRLYLNWMDNIRDWCISRQLWWGHRIPAYYCLDCNSDRVVLKDSADAGEEVSINWGKTKVSELDVIVSREKPSCCPKCGGNHIVQDPDVLDTWFSSALWTFATMGWPEKTPELEYFHPTSVLTTARDIIYLWVARMITSSMFFLGDIPFHEVYIYATVMNQDGQRMSKSLGTGVDPLELVDLYGADALRFALIEQTGKNQDMRFPATFECADCGTVNSSLVPHSGKCRKCGSKNVKVQSPLVEQSRNFANKIWNASRFVLMNIDPDNVSAGIPDRASLRMEDRWILSRLQKTIKTVNEGLASYDMDTAAHALYDFIWSEYCDWYVELAKPRLKTGEAPVVRSVLASVLECILRLLHPIMPHLTEEIWQALPETTHAAKVASIMQAPYAEFDAKMVDEDAERRMALLQEVVAGVRNLRAEGGVAPSKRVDAGLVLENGDAAVFTDEFRAGVELLARLQSFQVLQSEPEWAKKSFTGAVSAGVLHLNPGDAVDVEKELERLSAERANVEKDLTRAQAKLDNPSFVNKAPEAIVEKQRRIVQELTERREAIGNRIRVLS